uniref:Uncharacterized protein n=1 Tax=Anguilla anguilla TaxID=7936 RepID=A0A0E9TXZ5_ANGAN
MVKDEQRQQEEATSFRARPNTVTHKEPFMPKKKIAQSSCLRASSCRQSGVLRSGRSTKGHCVRRRCCAPV